MANLKFSDFTAYATTPITATSGLVAYEGTTNIQFTPAQLAPFTGIYASDGTIGTTRKALITDTIQFRDSGDTSDIFTLNTDGTFTLGLGATSTTTTGVAIGANASSTAESGIAIGAMTGHVTTAGLHSIAMGGSTRAAGSYSVAIGYNCGNNSTSVNSCVNIGSSAQGDGANSITLSATDAGDVVPSTAKAFGVYMSGKTTPDLEVIGGGESTLNTSLKVTGQAYTELHNTTNATLTVNWNDGNIQELTSLTGSLTFTASNPKAGATYIISLAQTGTVTATWTGVKWPAATAPTLSGAGKTDVVTLICYDATGAGLYYGAATLDLA